MCWCDALCALQKSHYSSVGTWSTCVEVICSSPGEQCAVPLGMKIEITTPETQSCGTNTRKTKRAD